MKRLAGGLNMAMRAAIKLFSVLALAALHAFAWGQPSDVREASSAAKPSLVAAEAAPAFEEGVHYHRLPVIVEREDPDRIEITEVFSYACIHCYTFEPILEAWRDTLPDDVVFRRVPAIFNETWALLARMYYAAQSLGVGEQMHMPLFEAIHKRGLDIRQSAVAEALFWKEAQVAAEDLKDVMASFGVATSLRQADARGRMYRVTGVPTLIVNGKYRIGTDGARGYKGMLRIADFLIDRERGAG